MEAYLWPSVSDFLHSASCFQVDTVVASISASFLLMPNLSPWCGLTTSVYPSIHPPINDAQLGCFCCLFIMKNAAMNVHGQSFVWTCLFISLLSVPSSRLASSWGTSVFTILKNCALFSNPTSKI